MEVRVLGPVEVVADDGTVVALGGRQQRLLAALIVRSGVCSPDWLIEAVWGDPPPASGVKALRVYVSRLRRALPEGIRIRTAESGYVLELDDHVLDAARFERLLAEGRESTKDGNAALAVSLLDRAQSLWRGAAYGELAYEDFARAEADRLEELRLLAAEERAEALLGLGRHAQLLPELRSLAAAHPLRERLQGQLLVALYRSGRQTEALEAFTAFRLLLRDELGLEPGAELRELQRRILEHDAGLGVVAPTEEPAAVLPSPPNRLVGRERELRDLAESLRREETRLLVLTGAGGSGKTRLALEAARANAGGFANGAALVELAPLRDPALVLPTIAAAVGIRDPTGDSLETLAAALRSRELLLVIDNAEHLQEAGRFYVQLLAAAPRLKLLVTSRTVLHLSGERVYPVEPLADDSATALFLERAHAAEPRFRPDENDRATIRRICERLDRLPLAIELAAARTTVLSPETLLDRLSQRLPVLAGGPRDAPERQRTLAATIDWSYELLTETEKRLFARLAVFVGGCSLEAAEEVCGADLDAIQSLVDMNLVRRADDRFTMLETIREYAAQRLDETGAADDVRRRHAEHFLRLADEAAEHLRGSPGEWLEQLEAEHDNFRAVFDRAGGSGPNPFALHLAGALSRFWHLRGHLTEGERRLESALGSDRRPTAARARALDGAASMALMRGDSATARIRADEALALHRSLGDRWGTGHSLFLRGQAVAEEGDYEEAQKLFDESARRFHEFGDHHYAALSTYLLASMCYELGDRQRARRLHEDNVRFAHQRGDRRIEALSFGLLGWMAADERALGEAVSLLKEGLRIHRELADRLPTAVTLCRFARVLALEGRAAAATRILSSFYALRDEIGYSARWLADINEETLATVRVELDEGAFDEAWNEGQVLTIDDAVALALDV